MIGGAVHDCLGSVSGSRASGVAPSLGHPLLDGYLSFVLPGARPNTVLATAYDLKVAFTVLDKDPLTVTTRDVLGFIEAQRPHRGANVVRLADAEVVCPRTIKRRLASLSGCMDICWRVEVSSNQCDRTVGTAPGPPELAVDSGIGSAAAACSGIRNN